MRARYGRSPWIDQFPKTRVPSYPRYHGATTADVVIIGGGLTGCTTAYALAANGVKVVLLEAEQIGRGSTAGSPGWISEDPGVRFADVEQAHGLRAARRAWQAWRRAALDFSALLRRLQIRCHLEPRPAAIVAVTPSEMPVLARDQNARRSAGFDAPALNPRALRAEFGITAAAGLRLKDGATMDPYRAALGLAAAAKQRGARLFERSEVRKITFDRKAADVQTDAGTIHTGRIVVATGAPTALFKALARHVWFRTTYAALTDPIPPRVRHQLGPRRSILRDAGNPPHVIRWVSDERLLIAGADQITVPPRQREKTTIQRTGQLMYELSLLYPEISGIQPAYGWGVPYADSGDGLPYIGPHRNFPFHLFAWGSASPTFSYLASRIVLRHVSGELDPSDDVFGFNR